MSDRDPKLPSPSPGARQPGRRGRPVGDREARRGELLQAGIRVIAAEGFAAASLRKVAKAAGCTTGAISYYFTDKEALVRAIVDSMFDQFDKLLAAGDAATDLRTRYARWIDLSTDSDAWLASFQLLSHARHEPGVAAIYQQRYQAYRNRLADTIRAEQAAGITRRDIPADMLADLLSSIGDGWMMMLPIEPERFAAERVNQMIDSITHLLAPPTS